MIQRLVLALCFFTLPSCLLITRLTQDQVRASTSYPVHNLNTGLDYATIQEAINALETLDGHTIEADAGAYYEHINISKSVFLLGEARDTTIIDGNGTGPIVTLSANNVSVANFTIRNGGNLFSPRDTCVFGDYLNNILIENNTLMDASNGIIFYGLHNSTMSHNLAEECSAMGLHFDTSANCTMINNTVTDSFQGIVVERSAGNFIQGNHLTNNSLGINLYESAENLVEGNSFMNSTVGVSLDACNGTNNFRNNNITSDAYNLIVWGSSLEGFVQNIDTSNTANNRTVYYITNLDNLTLDPVNCPNIGYLALVNCTHATVKDIDLSDDRDGILIAQSENCSLINETIANMRANITIGPENGGPQTHIIHGGLTFFKSDNNTIIDSRITNNSVGVCLYQSYGNLFYHNSFVDIDKPVISNFQSPASPPSGPYSTNEWNDGLEGNYWSSYNGTDLYGGPYQNETGSDGIGDTAYAIDGNNTDNYPLMGRFSEFTYTDGLPPGENKTLTVISNSTISNIGVFVWASSPNDGLQPGQTFIRFSATGENGSVGFCRLMFPKTVFPNVSSYVVMVDCVPVNATLLSVSNSTHVYLYFTYAHSTHEVIVTVEEFPSLLILPLSIEASLLAVIFYRRKHAL